MDNYEYNIKSDQIKKLYNKRDYATAAKVADSIDWRRVKNISMLSLVGDIYDRCKEYEKARNVLLIAYDRTSTGRQLAYKLTILSLRLKDFVEADEFYQDFIEIAPEDTTQYILKYRIAKTKGEDNDVLIQILEAYVDVEMDERWQYELAKLYAQTDQVRKCVDMCDQIILWFSEGKYVEKAMELKMKYEPLTPDQQEKYDNRESLKQTKIEDVPAAIPVEESTESSDVNRFDTKTDILNDTFGNIPVITDEVIKEEKKETEAKKEEASAESIEDNEARQQQEEDIKQLDKEMYGDNSTIEIYDFSDSSDEKMSKIGESLMKTTEIDIDEINFRAMNVSDYDTANIQAAIAKSMEIILKESNPADVPKVADNTAPINGDLGKTKSIDTLQIKELMNARTVMNADTTEIDTSVSVVRSAFDQPTEDEIRKETLMNEARINVMKEHLEREKAESMADKVNIYHTVPLNPMFEQEEDGQIGLAEPDEEEAQIEGQMTIEEVLHEYEIRAKYEAALAEVAKYEAEIKKQEERRKAREAAIVLEQNKQEEFSSESDEDTLSDENDELVQVEEGTDSDWIEDTGEIPTETVKHLDREDPVEEQEEESEELEIDEQQDLVNALFGELPSVEEVLEQRDDEEVPMPAFGQPGSIDAIPIVTPVVAPVVEPVVTPAIEPEVLPVSEEAEAQSEDMEIASEVAEPIDESEDDPGVVAQPEEEPEAEHEEQERVEIQNRDEEELGKIRLKDEYRAVFADFLDMPGLEEQLVKTIDRLVNEFEVDGTSKNNNVVIMGDAKTGKTTLALGIIKVANRARGNGRAGRKVAKIKAEILNKKGVTSAMPKILGADLVIEKAGNLTPTTVIDLIEIMNTYTEEMLIVMEDDQAAIERLFNTTPKLKKVFDNTIFIKGHDVDDYVHMAKDYAAKRRYVVNEMGTLALYERIGDIFGRNQCVTKDELEGIIDEAINHSERGGIKRLFGMVKRNKDEFGILKEEDFI
ncbi:MAG: hypothetical protein E7270_00060 [Lachnospiraceae bacterium]|nr:hypothetical protein [Lachnospiraceae bacterium]